MYDPEEEISTDAVDHDDPVHDHRICNSEGWALFDVDSTGILEIQRDDEAGVFPTDLHAVAFVRQKADAGSPYHRKALDVHLRTWPADAARGTHVAIRHLQLLKQCDPDTTTCGDIRRQLVAEFGEEVVSAAE